MSPTRRQFVSSTAAGLTLGAFGVGFPWLEACAQDPTSKPAGPVSPYHGYAGQPRAAAGPAGGYGSTTSADIEGPFYREGAPFEATLAPKGEPGERFVLRGRIVRGLECVPLAGAVLDVWQANAKGHYDNDDPTRPPQGFHLRGRVRTDAEGRFEVTTVRPGHYAIGKNRWRPAHLHVKATAKGCVPLTSQLYFADDPHNAKDPWFDASRVLSPKQVEGLLVATYEIVLAKAEK